MQIFDCWNIPIIEFKRMKKKNSNIIIMISQLKQWLDLKNTFPMNEFLPFFPRISRSNV